MKLHHSWISKHRIALWYGSPRTMPLGAFTVKPDDLADVLRRAGWTVTEPKTTTNEGATP